MPLYCRKCGTRLPTDGLFCPTCGTSRAANDHNPTSLSQQGALVSGTGRLPSGRMVHQRYRLLHTIGQGGMGAVYVAQDAQLGDRLVAVKEMSMSRLTLQELPRAVEQFRSEAHLLACLHHPNLPVIHEYFSEDDRWYLVMSFIEGQNLQTALDATAGKKLPLQDAIHIGIELCEVLDYLHNHEPQVIFRDLKPSNIILTSKGHICLVDFGIARHFKHEQTKDTTFYYSVGYAPPEQYGQSQTGPRSDIYSLGATLHQMLSGQSPADKPFQFSPLQLIDPTIPEPLTKLIAQMLEMNEQARPTNVTEVSKQLEKILTLDQVTAAGNASAERLERVRVDSAIQTKSTSRSTHRERIVTMVVGLFLCGTLDFFLAKLFMSLANSDFFQSLGGSPFLPSPASILIGCVGVLPLFFFGTKFGPWTGCVVALGVLLAHVVSGFFAYFNMGNLWYWYAIFVFFGSFSGLAFVKTKGRYESPNALASAFLFGSIALIVGCFLQSLGDTLVGIGSSIWANLSFTFLSYVVSIILLPFLLLLSSRMVKPREVL